VNQYVMDEDEETYSFNVRIAASELMVQFSDNFGTTLLNGVIAAAHALLGEANSLRNSGDANWWKPREACLLAMGRLSEELTEAIQQNQVQFDLAGLFSHVVLDSMNTPTCPFLQGRAIWFASRFASVLPAELAQQYVATASAAVTQSDSVPVRICAVKAIQAFSLSMESASLVAFQPQMLEGLLVLMPSATEEIAILVLETLAPVLKIGPQAAATYAPRITEHTLEIWSKFQTGSYFLIPSKHVAARSWLTFFTFSARLPFPCYRGGRFRGSGIERTLLTATARSGFPCLAACGQCSLRSFCDRQLDRRCHGYYWNAHQGFEGAHFCGPR
jgi:hypothetical protein